MPEFLVLGQFLSLSFLCLSFGFYGHERFKRTSKQKPVLKAVTDDQHILHIFVVLIRISK